MAIGDVAADKIADAQRGQHRRDQRRPGVDAGAERGCEIAGSQHLETHHDRAGHEGDEIEREDDGEPTLARLASWRLGRHSPLLVRPRRLAPWSRSSGRTSYPAV